MQSSPRSFLGHLYHSPKGLLLLSSPSSPRPFSRPRQLLFYLSLPSVFHRPPRLTAGRTLGSSVRFGELCVTWTSCSDPLGLESLLSFSVHIPYPQPPHHTPDPSTSGCPTWLIPWTWVAPILHVLKKELALAGAPEDKQ